jgi:hypothetical protein
VGGRDHVLVDDLQRDEAELVEQVTPAQLALDDQGLEVADQVEVVPGGCGRPGGLVVRHHPDPVLRHAGPRHRLPHPVTPGHVHDVEVREGGMEDGGAIEAREPRHLLELRRGPREVVPHQLRPEHAVGRRPEVGDDRQVVLAVSGLMRSPERAVLPTAPAAPPLVDREEVLVGPAGDAGVGEGATQQRRAAALAGADEIRGRRLHPRHPRRFSVAARRRPTPTNAENGCACRTYRS